MKKKVALVSICYSAIYIGKCSWGCEFDGYCVASPYFSLRSSAIRNARKFFKKIGYEVEVVK